MADANQQRAVTAAFAPPPPLWKHFTRENLDKFEQIKTEASKDKDGKPAHNKKWTPKELRDLEVPPELRFLVPPEAPTGQYSVFGELQPLSTTLPSLQEQGINQLYPEPTKDGADSTQPSQPLNHAYYLLKISKSLLLNFLEFVGVLSVAPEQFESKVEDMRNLFINAHHLLNLYRPHQSRESLITMMEEQLEKTKEEIQNMDKVKAEIEGVLSELEGEGSRVDPTGQTKDAVCQPGADSQKSSTTDSRIVWDLLNGEV